MGKIGNEDWILQYREKQHFLNLKRHFLSLFLTNVLPVNP